MRRSSRLDLCPPCLGAGGPWKGQPSARRSPPHAPGRVGGGVVWPSLPQCPGCRAGSGVPRRHCSHVNPFPGRPGDRLCSQRNTARLWAAAETHTGTIGASRSRRAVQAPTAEQAHSASRPQPRQKHPLPQQLGSRLREPSRAPQSLFFFSRRHPHPHLVPQGKPLQLPDGNHNYASVSGGPGPSPH